MTNIGDRVSGNDLTIPVGTIIGSSPDTRWVREVDGWHRDSPRRHHAYPSQTTISGTVTALHPFVETLAQYQQRFAVTCLNMGMRAGGGGYLEGARAIVSRLRLENPIDQRLRVGSWVSVSVNGRAVPNGAVLLSGAPEREAGHTLYHWETYARHLSGPRHDPDYLLLRVVGLPDSYETDEWPEPAANEGDLIRQFRIRAWDEGWREKSDRSWCGDFESSISVLGLSEGVASLLRRDGEPDVPAGPLATGVPTTGALVASAAELDAAPIGTVVDEGGAWHATKEEAGWRNDSGSLQYVAWHSALRYRSVPVVGPTFPHGTPVSSADQRSCVPGAVFAYDSESRYIWGRTDVGARAQGNIGLTIGNPNTCQSGTSTTVVWDGVSPIHESPVRDHWEMQNMPVGTIIGQHWNDAAAEFNYLWHKDDRDHWTPLTGGGRRGQSSDFNVGGLRYRYIPVPGVPRPDSAPTVPVAENVDF